jgi:hypothetical protein
MDDLDDELRRLLASRADQVRSDLSGPAIRAKADPERAPARRTHRYLPLVAAAGVTVVATLGLLFSQGGGGGPAPHVSPATAIITGAPAAPSSLTTTTPQLVPGPGAVGPSSPGPASQQTSGRPSGQTSGRDQHRTLTRSLPSP